MQNGVLIFSRFEKSHLIVISDTMKLVIICYLVFTTKTKFFFSFFVEEKLQKHEGVFLYFVLLFFG